jgi:hypothetical protein
MIHKYKFRGGSNLWGKVGGATLVLTALLLFCGLRLNIRHVDNYFPLEAGLTLEYDYQRTKGNLKETGRLTVTNMAPETLANRKVVPRKYDMRKASGTTQTYLAFFHPDGSGVLFWALKTPKDPQPQTLPHPFYYVKHPLETGNAWGVGQEPRGRLESVSESLTVPAGTFKNCLKVKLTFPDNTPIREASLWFAEKVGIVQSVYLYRDGTEELFRLTGITEKAN